MQPEAKVFDSLSQFVGQCTDELNAGSIHFRVEEITNPKVQSYAERITREQNGVTKVVDVIIYRTQVDGVVLVKTLTSRHGFLWSFLWAVWLFNGQYVHTLLTEAEDFLGEVAKITLTQVGEKIDIEVTTEKFTGAWEVFTSTAQVTQVRFVLFESVYLLD